MKSQSGERGIVGGQVEIASVYCFSLSSARIVYRLYFSQVLHKLLHKMSETEAKTDAAAEQPTAEEIKATKRPAEVSH